MNRFHMLVFAVALSALAASERDTLVEEGRRWWAHVERMASDELKGRDIGSEGYEVAARYVAAEYEKVGLAPGGSGSSYFQPVRFVQRTIDESRSSLSIERDGQTAGLSLGEDANIGMRVTPAAKLSAEMVFVGYGTRVPEANYDDFRDADVKGKIAVMISGQPPGISAALVSHYQSQSERAKALEAAGAVGIATIGNPRTSDIPWARSTQARLQPALSLEEKSAGKTSIQLSISINPAQGNKFFAGSGHSLEEIFRLADARQPLPHFAMKGKLIARAAYRQSKVGSENVIGIRWGADPVLRNEFIAVTAHLDHLGVNPKLTGDQIYNGAMDNASGVASLIEAARHLNAAGAQLKRSVAFIALTGEEKGLLGSSYYAQHPVFGKEKKARVVGNLNMDMYLPLFPLKGLVILGVEESTLGDLARAGATAAGIEVWPDPAPERNSFIRSDQYSFIRNGTPALAFKFGYKKGTPEEKAVQGWLRERYHAVGDDLAQPVDREAAATYNRVLASMIRSAANAAEAPRWKDASFFKRFAKN
ncbi:MAG: M28 family metallopeptidase [Acidobacteriota bacterium]